MLLHVYKLSPCKRRSLGKESATAYFFQEQRRPFDLTHISQSDPDHFLRITPPTKTAENLRAICAGPVL